MMLRLALLLGTVALLASCGATPAPGAGTSAPDGGVGAGVDGRTFLSTGVEVDGTDHPLVPGSSIRTTFADGRIAVTAGCNSMGGEVRFDGARMRLTSGLSTTELGCPEQLMAQDRWVADLLTAGCDLSLRGDRLTLRSGRTVIALQDEHTLVPDAPLVMTEWRLDTIVEDEVASSVPAGVTATLAFGSGLPKAFVQTGCNQGSGDVECGPATMRFGPLTLTSRACSDRSAASVESAIVSILRGEVGYVVHGRALTLTNGSRSLVYRAP
jgi:heat shock protein HslJ